MPKVLVGCEESGVVSAAFRKLGHDAWSCDLQPTRGLGSRHYTCDVMEIIPMGWDLIILHPDCTKMAVSGNRWYGKGTPGYQQRLDAIDWTLSLWELALKYSERAALENPNSVIFPYLKKLGHTVQYIQPWQFGHGETKNTGLALHNLPPLKPTKLALGREQRVWKMPPGPNRKRDRSATYPGIAAAMASQWGEVLP